MVAPRHVVTSFLQHREKILLLQRSERVGTFQGRWAGVSGYIPEGLEPLQQALQEIKEEVNLTEDQVELVSSGDPLLISDMEGRQWLVHPFLFRVEDVSSVRLDWESSGSTWVAPEEITNFLTVPGLKETWDQLRKK